MSYYSSSFLEYSRIVRMHYSQLVCNRMGSRSVKIMRDKRQKIIYAYLGDVVVWQSSKSHILRMVFGEMPLLKNVKNQSTRNTQDLIQCYLKTSLYRAGLWNRSNQSKILQKQFMKLGSKVIIFLKKSLQRSRLQSILKAEIFPVTSVSTIAG